MIDTQLHIPPYGKSDIFYKVAQAIAETLPVEAKEKKLLEGFLTGKERLIDELKNIKKFKKQTGMFE